MIHIATYYAFILNFKVRPFTVAKSERQLSHTMGSIVLPHLRNGWQVDQAILTEEERLVVIRFGRDGDPDCICQDEVLAKIAERVKNFAVIYVCDLDEVPDFVRHLDRAYRFT